MYKVLIGGFVVGAMAVGCSKSAVCDSKIVNKDMAYEHTSTFCVYPSGTSCMTKRFNNSSGTMCTTIDGTVTSYGNAKHGQVDLHNL